MPQPAVPRPDPRKGGEPMQTRKKVALSERARIQEAKFWEMMRAAESGKRCLK